MNLRPVLFQRGGWARLKAREPQVLWEAGLVGGGLVLIGLTLHLYPTFDGAAHPPTSRTFLSSTAADRQIEAARAYLTAHPDDFNTYVALAMAYYEKGPEHYVEAMNALEKARGLGATSEHLFFYAGVMYDALGLPDYAINEFAKYLRHHPNDYETTIRLANLHFRQKHFDEAQGLYQEALHLWSKDATAWFNYAVINKEKGNYPVALSSLEQVVRIAGRLPPGGLYEEGEIYRLQGDANKALQYYQLELAIQPTFIPAMEATELILRAKGDLKQARAIHKRITELKKQQQAQQAQEQAQAKAKAQAEAQAQAQAEAPAQQAPVPAAAQAPASPSAPAQAPAPAPAAVVSAPAISTTPQPNP